jgi:hypothetical protein
VNGAGFYIYLLSKWDSGCKADFYPIHRLLGATSLLSGFVAILMGLAEDQAFNMYAHGGLKNFFSANAHSFQYGILSALGLVLFLLAISVMSTFLIFKEQAMPAPASDVKQGSLP